MKFPSYAGRRVLITGHTGFKGSWLSLWLSRMGARVSGFALEPDTEPSLYVEARIGERVESMIGDIRDPDLVTEAVTGFAPEIVFHLAAQPLVRRGYAEPLRTFGTNVMGTANLLEAVRRAGSVKAVVVVTSDKCYREDSSTFGYRETDPLGGHDPYSASKAAAELATNAWRASFGNCPGAALVATARAGNVIGGGDFADFRLVPDCMRALMAGQPLEIRNPRSIRPWQHVLEPLSGYLWLGARLLQEGPAYAEAWNFGPLEQKGIPAQMVAEKLIELWGHGRWVHTDPGFAKVETGQLRLSWEKAASRLDWRPVYSWAEALAEIVAWFKAFQAAEDMLATGRAHIHHYVQKAATLPQTFWTL